MVAAKQTEYTKQPVPFWQVPGVFDHLDPLIDPLLEVWNGRFTKEDIFRQLISRNWQLWLVKRDDEVRAMCMTTIKVYPRIKVLDVVGLSGPGVDEYIHLLDEVAEWSKQFGCTRLEVTGRAGWTKKLKGWKRPFCFFEKDIA